MKTSRMGFRSIVILGGGALMFVPALIAGWFYTGALQREAERMVAESLRSRGELAAELLARRLHATWQVVNEYAKTAGVKTPEQAQRDFTVVESLDERIAWIGMANVEGRVLAASRGMLEGADVSQRPWFRRGLGGPFAGDVHEALLLAKLLAKDNEPIRFIDFAAPVSGKDAATDGVIGVHIRWDWLRDQLAGISGRGVDILLVSREGRVLYGPGDMEGKLLGAGIGVAAGQAHTVVRPASWPDGRDYMTAIIPGVSYRDLPSFGWSVIVRENIDTALRPTRDLARTFWTILGSAGLISLALVSMGAGWLATPLRRQGAYAASLASGHASGPPYEETRYQEVANLSAALVRIQSHMTSTPAPAFNERDGQSRADEIGSVKRLQ